MTLPKNDSDIYHHVLNHRKELRSFFHAEETYPTPQEIDQVIVILGSSRSGSSLLFYLLSQNPNIISLQGEEVTFTKLFGLNKINSTKDSDQLEHDIKFNYQDLAQEMLFDAGYNSTSLDRLPLDRAQRLILQWPEIIFNQEELKKACQLENWEEVIGELKRKYSKINLGFYDKYLNPQDSTNNDKKIFIEEPPYIIPKAKSYRSKKAKKILLLKSSINAFRAELLPRLYPSAEFKYIHLSRHPAASINGLMDGWLSTGFHTHNLNHLTKLSIKGYNDQNWWKFDLPPGWKQYTEKPLEEVCAFQWSASNKSILNFLENKKAARIKYESMTDHQSLFQTLKILCEELNLDDQFLENLPHPPHIMSVNRPDQHRWKARAELIGPIINTDEMLMLTKSLGYNE